MQHCDSVSITVAWATVIHMSYEESGMKLRDLARNSQNPTSFLSALRIFLRRFVSPETARSSRGSYESVFMSSVPRHLIFLQQTTMVPLHRVLHHPRYPVSHVTFPIWPYHGHRNLRPRMCYRPVSSSYLPDFHTEPGYGVS